MTPLATNCPHCRATLGGPEAGPTSTCPECGRPTTGPVGAIDPKRRPGRTRLAAGLAVAAIGVAGVVIYRNFPDDLMRDATRAATRALATAGGPAKREVSDAPDAAETRTPLAVIGGGKAVVALGSPAGPKTYQEGVGTRQGILLRELVRQAMLIAARDELGLATRDAILDDEAPGAAGGPAVELATLFRPGASRALVRRAGGDKAETLLKVDLGPNPDSGEYASNLAKQAEGLSRSEFVAALKKLGAAGSANQVRAGGAVPEEVEGRMSSLGLVENFAAIRDLHALIRGEGESPERLGALARAYAQLGALTEFQWSPAHKAFKARAMLYAERLLAREPGSARALRDRAFVRALVGNHAEALGDLAAAEEAAAKAPAAAPAWVGAIDAYCKHDLARLKATGGPHARLALFLRMMAVEFPQETRASVLAARDVVGADAGCYRAYDVICQSGELGDLHVATVAGPEAFTKLFPAKLKSIGGLPAGAAAKLDGRADEPGVVAALAKAGGAAEDAGEPSWGLLAHLARETRFAQVFRRLVFMHYKWAVPVDDYWAEVRPLVADHRYRPYLDTMALPPREASKSFGAFLDTFDPADLEMSERYLTDALSRTGHPRAYGAWGMAMYHGDILKCDFAMAITGTDKVKGTYGRNLLRISPHNPFAMATLVAHDWDGVKAEVPAWREKAGDAPALLLALGEQDAKAKQYDAAIKALARSVELSPDRAAYQALASCYEARGDSDRWKATLDEYLGKTEDAGLDHARVRVQIANDYMSRGQFAEAKPYAEAAAQTWAGWAMLCAANCAEGLGDLDEAELWIRRNTERYPNISWSDWYLFCKRTDHGDVEAARAWTAAYLTAVGARRPGRPRGGRLLLLADRLDGESPRRLRPDLRGDADGADRRRPDGRRRRDGRQGPAR